MEETTDMLSISGDGFEYIFNKLKGSLSSMKVNGKELLKNGPELNVWRAPLANETDEWGYGAQIPGTGLQAMVTCLPLNGILPDLIN